MAFELPMRLAFGPGGEWVIKGSAGSHGDAGWEMVRCDDRAEALMLMQLWPEARMPCWSLIESGE
jgi:hypothetical protein